MKMMPPTQNDPLPDTGGLETSDPDTGGSATSLLAPDRIGNYQILRLLGEGGMGTVYQALQDHPRRLVALKVLRPGRRSAALSRRFVFEAEVLAHLHHPGIAHVYEVGQADFGHGSQPFIAMEYVEGQPLDAFVRGTRAFVRGTRLDLRARLELFADVCDAVQHAHASGFVHRDLKPANILVDGDGRAKVLDFGVSRAVEDANRPDILRTRVGTIVGTLGYMSPEQFGGSTPEITTACDVYSLGVIAFELLTGQLPHDLKGTTITEAARMVSDLDPQRMGCIDPKLRGELETIVAKALERDPVRRYTCAGELAADVRRFLCDEPILARPASTMVQLSKLARRHRSFVRGVAASLAVTLPIFVASLVYTVAQQGPRASSDPSCPCQLCSESPRETPSSDHVTSHAPGRTASE